MGQNAFLDKWQHKVDNAMIQGGQVGNQQFCDLMCIVLNREYGWGAERLKKLIRSIAKMHDHFADAYELSDEADCLQTEMDTALRQILGDDTQTFEQRYGECMHYDYKRGKWGK